ncbi:glycoside hydrolase family 18 protein [Maribellus sp. YY47]|uniref:glycoside hydrolase family 18 protein n=1 Tax=Maribellus sp. YY47 TaxID=2929486 RepID=UPI0020009B6E|nr:glycoside hydrolase family 18 protein [Maribellus sp. YY47]MCK3686290.1 glycoside hydrolase family 18 protein [Maribellus sp. YY47]
MIRYFLPLVMIFLLLGCGSRKQAHVSETPKINIMAYYFPREEFNVEQLQLEKLTHLIFSFSYVIDGEMAFKNELSDTRLKQLVAEKQKHPNLKVMVACGGWGADGFSDAVLTEESRSKFIRSAVNFVQKYQLDGIDIDWEYPTASGAGIKARPEDKQNFTAFIKGLRAELNKLDRPQILTFAAAGWKNYFEYIELNEVMKYVDYINLMTYDQAGGGNKFTRHHTALGRVTLNDLSETPLGMEMKNRTEEEGEDEGSWEPQSAEGIINFCIEHGVDPGKIVIGAAFYGKGWKGVPPQNNGLYQPNAGAVRGANYSRLLGEYIDKNGFERHWDPIAKAPFLYHPTDSIFITYDDPESVKLKTQFALDHQLGGIMFWELGGDSYESGGLLDAIYNQAVH